MSTVKHCFGEWHEKFEKTILAPGVINAETFVADFFGQTLKDLKAKHKKLRPQLCRKYGISRGLGMEDEEVKNSINSIARDENAIFWRDYATAMKWTFPALINALYCCYKDLTFYQEKIRSGEAYNVSCFGPFFGPPSSSYRSRHEIGQIGKNNELIILVSAPGDFHPWVGKGQDGPGNVHSIFKGYAEQSEGRIRFCPIQKGKTSEHGKHLVKPDSQDPMDPDLRDYYVALADQEYDCDLWKAYWIANVKREIVNAKLNYTRVLSKVIFVGIYGGKEGAASERRELAKLAKIFDARQAITDVTDLWIESVARCISCGLNETCFPGWLSAIALFEACWGRVLLCTPIKQTRLQTAFVLPSDFEAYIKNPECAELVDAFKDKLVENDPPEPQQMLKNSDGQPTFTSVQNCGSVPKGSKVSPAPEDPGLH